MCWSTEFPSLPPVPVEEPLLCSLPLPCLSPSTVFPCLQFETVPGSGHHQVRYVLLSSSQSVHVHEFAFTSVRPTRGAGGPRQGSKQ